MEENGIERDLMSEEEFADYVNNIIPKIKKYKNIEEVKSLLDTYGALSTRKVKSFNRAVKRGLITEDGIPIPRRPYNNRGNTSKRKNAHSRTENEIKKNIYEQYREYKRNQND